MTMPDEIWAGISSKNYNYWHKAGGGITTKYIRADLARPPSADCPEEKGLSVVIESLQKTSDQGAHHHLGLFEVRMILRILKRYTALAAAPQYNPTADQVRGVDIEVLRGAIKHMKDYPNNHSAAPRNIVLSAASAYLEMIEKEMNRFEKPLTERFKDFFTWYLWIPTAAQIIFKKDTNDEQKHRI